MGIKLNGIRRNRSELVLMLLLCWLIELNVQMSISNASRFQFPRYMKSSRPVLQTCHRTPLASILQPSKIQSQLTSTNMLVLISCCVFYSIQCNWQFAVAVFRWVRCQVVMRSNVCLWSRYHHLRLCWYWHRQSIWYVMIVIAEFAFHLNTFLAGIFTKSLDGV